MLTWLWEGGTPCLEPVLQVTSLKKDQKLSEGQRAEMSV